LSAKEFQEFLRQAQKLVDARLTELMDRETSVPEALRDAMRYSLLAPGKRLRPVLVILATTVSGGVQEHALVAACAAEMVHTYSLVHDDLPAMDDDDLRRGLPTCHKKYGDALAILAGDALLTLSFQVLAENYSPVIAAACCRELARGAGAAGMVGGQVDDLVWENATGQRRDPLMPRPTLPPSVEALESIHCQKTGALFQACLKMGAWVALANQANKITQPDPNVLAGLDQFGRCFGLVFQITDDLLDVEGTSQETGKRTQKDAVRGKLTYPGLLGIEESRRRAALLEAQAHESLRFLGPRSEPLLALLRFVLARDR
jgi:geranylgeranyl diphosphate synthase, type II